MERCTNCTGQVIVMAQKGSGFCGRLCENAYADYQAELKDAPACIVCTTGRMLPVGGDLVCASCGASSGSAP